MPISYKDYPADWKERRARILVRAGNLCEQCSIPNGLKGWRFPSGEFRTPDQIASEWMPVEDENALKKVLARPITTIVLTIAHLDRTGPPGPNDGPLNCPDDRLKALCQACHLHLDRYRHQAKAAATRRQKAGLASLFPTQP